MNTTASEERPQPPCPLTDTERRLWLLEELVEGTTAYDPSVVLRLSGRLHRQALRAALRTVVDRHPVLCSRTFLVDGMVMRTGSPSKVDLVSRDLRGQPPPVLDQAVTAAATEALDPGAGPLLRVTLLRAGNSEWLLVIHAHALAADSASLQLFLDELASDYRSTLMGDAPGIGARAQADASEEPAVGGPATATVDWWRSALADASPRTPLPADRPAAVAANFVGGRQTRRVSRSTADRLRRLAGAAVVSPEVVYLSIFAALLARYGGGPTVPVGVPHRAHAPRDRVGRFEDELPVPVDVSGEPSLRQLVDRTGTSLSDARAHALPLLQLGTSLSPGFGRGALFEVGFRYEPPLRAPELPGLLVAIEPVPRTEVPLDLSLVVGDPGIGGVDLTIEYTAARFETRSVQRVIEHVLKLLTTTLDRPDTPTTALELLPAAERSTVRRWGRGTPPAQGPETVVSWFAQVVEQRHSAEAVRAPDGSLTFGELADASDRVASRLRTAGVGPGDRVAVELDRSIALPSALLGVLKCGAAYVPVDPDYPADRVRCILEDAAVTAGVTAGGLPTGSVALPLPPARVIRLDGDPPDWGDATPPLASASRPTGADLAYVIYTSGSTGLPKGVMVEHRSLCALLRSMAAEPGLATGETMLGVTTPAFDLSVPDLFLPLVTGARLVLASRSDSFDGTALAGLVETSQAALLQATPATWRLLLEAGWAGQRTLRAVVGGEAVPAALATDLLARTAGVWSFYGPTEATVWCAALPLHKFSPTSLSDPVQLGRPLPGVELYVVNREDRLAPIGLVGELLVGGAGVARGYWGRPETTNERFATSPVAEGRRVYRTGDLARWSSDGLLHFAGRADFQVKLRGFRIELGEVEAALRAAPGVQDAVVVRREERAGQPRLVGYVSGEQPNPATVRRATAGRLPAYMVPAVVVVMPELPRNTNGKIDREALPGPDCDGRDAPPVAPRTPVEEAVAHLWQEILGVERIGVHDDFFDDLGGDSLLVLRLATRLPRVLPVTLSIRQFFEHSTIEALAVAVTREMAVLSGDPSLDMLLAELEASGDPAS